MDEKRRLPVLDEGGVGRRRILQGLFVGVGAQVAAPGLGQAQEHSHTVTALQTKAKAADWKPEFLDAHQFATLTTLCARIVPGSVEAQADRFVDGLLAVDNQDRRRRFLSALGAVEGAALSRFGRPFKSLGEGEQVEILSAAAAGDPGREEWIWTPGTPVEKPEEGPEVVTLRDHFDVLKGWIADAYYSSETGLKELGYTGQMFFESSPGCTHDDHA